jgi:hypothetical protein
MIAHAVKEGLTFEAFDDTSSVTSKYVIHYTGGY